MCCYCYDILHEQIFITFQVGILVIFTILLSCIKYKLEIITLLPETPILAFIEEIHFCI